MHYLRIVNSGGRQKWHGHDHKDEAHATLPIWRGARRPTTVRSHPGSFHASTENGSGRGALFVLVSCSRATPMGMPASSGWRRCTNIGDGKSRDVGDAGMRELNNRMYAYAFSAAFVMFCRIARKRLPVRRSWNMLVTTTSGHCGKIKVGLAISRGRISSTSGSFALHRIRIDGLISGADGQTRMTAVAGPRVAKGSGRFIRSQGQGKWSGTGPSGVCSCIWTAVRS